MRKIIDLKTILIKVTLISSFFINMLNAYIIRYEIITNDLLLSGVAGGSLIAIVIAIGITYLKAEGAYTQNDKKDIMCV